MKSIVKQIGAGLQGTGYDVTIGQMEMTMESLDKLGILEEIITANKEHAFIDSFEDGEIEFFIHQPLKIDYRVKAARKKKG